VARGLRPSVTNRFVDLVREGIDCVPRGDA